MGQYQCIKQIEHDGMGKVWLVQHTQTSICYAVKRCTDIKEVHMLSMLHHPGIPRMLAYHEAHGFVYMIMEYIDGKTLSQVIQETGIIKEKDVIHWILQVLDIVCYLHKNHILYCDMKPENIIVSKSGTIYLIDFGIAIHKDKQEVTHYGTIGYAAKEQYDEDLLDERVDVYGVAKVMMALLSGVYNGEELQHLSLAQIDMSKGLRNIISHCIEEDRKYRYQSMNALKRDLEKCLAKKTIYERIQHLYMRCISSGYKYE